MFCASYKSILVGTEMEEGRVTDACLGPTCVRTSLLVWIKVMSRTATLAHQQQRGNFYVLIYMVRVSSTSTFECDFSSFKCSVTATKTIWIVFAHLLRMFDFFLAKLPPFVTMVDKALTSLSESFGSQARDTPRPELSSPCRCPRCAGRASTSCAVSTFPRDPAL